MKYCYSCQILRNPEITRRTFKNIQMPNFIKILPVGSVLFHIDRRVARPNEANTVTPGLTKIIRSGITFVSRNVISRRFL